LLSCFYYFWIRCIWE